MPKKTQQEEASEKEQAALGEYARAVINLQKKGKLEAIDKKFSSPRLSAIPWVGPDLADTLAQKTADRAKQDPAFMADPDQRAFLFQSNPEVAFKKVYAIAQSTFSDNLVKRIGAMAPKLTDSNTQKIDTAIQYLVGSKMRKFIDENPHVVELTDDIASEMGGTGNLTRKYVKDSLKNSLEGGDLPEYMHFLRDVLQDPKKKGKISESYFSPWIWAPDRINDWIQQNTGRKTDITKAMGDYLHPGEDFDTSEMQGLLDSKAKKALYDKRTVSIRKAFNKWKLSKGRNELHKFADEDLEDK
jgi:hypothetical protein